MEGENPEFSLVGSFRSRFFYFTYKDCCYNTIFSVLMADGFKWHVYKSTMLKPKSQFDLVTSI
jgi:hypothetical protein